MSVASVNVDRINYLNIFLIVNSAILSFLIPFKLFLFAYTILGPLHYLTEISWLHKSNYFTKGKKDYLLLVALGVISYLANFTDILSFPLEGYLSDTSKGIGEGSIFVSLVAAFMFLAFDKRMPRLIGIGTAIIIAILFRYVDDSIYQPYFLAIAVFLPTIIHVCFFTFLFMLYGSMMGKSRSGYISCIVFAIVCIGFFVFVPTMRYEVDKIFLSPIKEFFPIISISLINVFGFAEVPYYQLTGEQYHTIFFSTEGQMFMRFIAFIYFYHYLNWFSKTSIIKWHEISWDKLIIIGTLWVLSIAVYLYDYGLGFKVLFTLSMMHVFLEFPLNFKTMRTIGNKILNRS